MLYYTREMSYPQVIKKKTVLAFGAFDGLHDGHRFFLRQARALGERLIASVASDENIAVLKGRAPLSPLATRIEALAATALADEVVAGDVGFDKWSAVKRFSPEIVALGYDQTHLASALSSHIKKQCLNIALVTIPAYKPETLHSRLRRVV